jgi:transmembrane sensor
MDESIKILLIKYITGDADEKERLEARQWIRESQDNMAYFISLKGIWQDSLLHPGERVVNTDEAFDRLRARLQIPPIIQPAVQPDSFRLPETQRRQWPRLAKAAVIAALTLTAGMIGMIVLRKGSPGQPPPIAFEIFVPNGKMKKIVLPDSSEVWLNAGTRLSYAAGFGEGKREVSLEGEGYFAVKHNEKIPFIVRTQGYTVRDIGTIFTINAYPDSKNFETAVIEGRIEVRCDLPRTASAEKILLDKNEVLKIVGTGTASPVRDNTPRQTDSLHRVPQPVLVNTFISTAPDMDHYTGWKDHLLVFNEETFDQVAQRLERTFDVRIHINSDQLARLRYTGRFNKVQSITDALEIIKKTTPIVYHLEKGIITISPEKRVR